MALAWVAIFAGGFVLFTFRDDLGYVAQRLRAEATGEPVEQGQEIRIPMAIDGHFWVDAQVNGKRVKFLIDSGATMTTIGRKTAARVGVPVSPTRNQIVRTGNGFIRVATGSAGTLGGRGHRTPEPRCPHCGRRGSQRPGHEFPVVAAALGGGGPLAGFGPLTTEILYIMYIIILLDLTAGTPMEKPS